MLHVNSHMRKLLIKLALPVANGLKSSDYGRLLTSREIIVPKGKTASQSHSFLLWGNALTAALPIIAEQLIRTICRGKTAFQNNKKVK